MFLFTSRTAFCCFLISATKISLIAQPSTPSLDAQLKRHVITAESAQQHIIFQNLLPGETYGLLVPGGEPCLAQCMPEVSVLTPNTQVISYNSTIHLLKFVASAPVMEFQFDYPCSWDQSNPPRHYISMMHVGEKKKKSLGAPESVVAVTQKDADYLIKQVLVAGDCFDVSNITYTGRPPQIGEFTNGATSVGFNSGVIMATGNIIVAPGPNNSDGSSAGYEMNTPDPELQAQTTGVLFDMANIEFDFTPTQSPITFEFVFASEEYCEFVNTMFNDVFGFFLSGPGIIGSQNLAVIPMTATPITINTINHLDNPGYYVHNTPETGNNCGTIPPATGVAVDELEYDGFTRKMVAVANVTPCSTYHIKLKIADVGDGVWDSAVFLKGGSFDAGGNASIDWLVNGVSNVDTVSEGCGTVGLLIKRSGTDLFQPQPVPFSITGTAISGADYGPIISLYTIPAGQSQIIVPVNIVNDLIPENAETVILRLNNLCSCLKDREILTILDYKNMAPKVDTLSICTPGVATLAVIPGGGVSPFTYQWSTGDNGPSISPLVAMATTYTVTITDGCGKTSSAVGQVKINQAPQAQLSGVVPQICPGQSVNLDINFMGIGPFDITYTINNNPQPPITGILNSTYTLMVSQPGTYQITTVIDGAGCSGAALGQVVVSPSNLDLSGVTSNILCAGFPTGSINTSVAGGQGTYSYVWQSPIPIGAIADPSGLIPGNYTVTVTDGSGCTDSQTFTITTLPPLGTNIGSIQAANCFVPSGGNINLNVIGGTPNYIYAWSNASMVEDPQNLVAGIYTVTITDANGCSKTASAMVPGDFMAPAVAAAPSNAITCSAPIVTLDGTGSSTGVNFSYSWTASPGNITSGNNTLNPTVDQAGTYILTVQNLSSGCTASAGSIVNSNNATPAATAGLDATITCAATNVTLNGLGSSSGGNFSYLWTASAGGNILGGATTLNPIVTATGTYTLLVTNNQNGCTAIDAATVDNNLTPPNAAVAPPALITCTVSDVTLNGSASTPAGITYQWITSNGFIVSGQNTTTAIVNEAGQYTLVVMNPTNGCTSSQTVTINQDFSAPIAVATASNSITCVNLQATVSALGSQMIPSDTFVWSTLDGSFVSGTSTLSPTVNAPGTYSIVITNLTSMCTSQASIVVGADNVPPVASAGLPATLSCSNTSVVIGDPLSASDPNLSYVWFAAPGNITANGNTSMPTVNQPGTYNLIVSNALNGCSNTASVIIPQNITPPVAIVAAGGEINCTAQTVQLNGASSSTGPTYSYQWTSASGIGIGAGDNTLTPTITSSGTYTLVVTNAANGCTNSAATSVTTDASVPMAVATPQGILNCSVQTIPINSTGSASGPTIIYQWGTVDGSILSGIGTPQIIVGAPGQYTLVVTNTANNCTATITTLVLENITAPTAEAGANMTLNCTIPAMNLDGSNSSVGPQFGYSWTASSGGNFISATNIISPQINEPGVYQISVTDVTNGCTSIDQVVILADVNDPVVTLAQPPTLTCLITQANISSTGSSAGANFMYQWTGPGLQSNPNNATATINLPGNYTLVITNISNGCTTEASVPVSQNILAPIADAGPDALLNCDTPTLNIGGSNNSTGPNFTYNWVDPGGIISGWNTLSPEVAGGGTYAIIVTNTANGCTTVDPMNVVIDFEAPQANGGPSFQLTCTDNTYVLQAAAPIGPNFTYQWTTIGGSFISPTNILNPTVDGAGAYSLLVTNTTNGCTSSPTVQITQAADVPLAVANSAANLTCVVTDLTLNGTGTNNGVGYTVLWTSSNGGNIVSGNNTLNPIIDAPGTYTITVQNLVNLCQANSSVTVLEDLVPPPITAGAQQTLTCTTMSLNLQGTNGALGLFSYIWSTPNGNIVSGSNTLNPIIDEIGYYELEATSNQNGCTSVVGVNVISNTVNPVSAIAQPNALTCVVDEVTLNAGGSSTGEMAYVWTTAGGNIVNQTDSSAIVVNEPGPYTLQVTDNVNGCTSSVTVIVPEDIQNPTAIAVADSSITCMITAFNLDGTGSSNNGNFFYQWTTTNGNILSGANSLSPKITAGGVYNLLVTNNDNGCTATDQVIVNTDTQDPVVAIATPGAIGCTQLSVVLNGSGSSGGPNFGYLWTTVDGNIVSGINTNAATVSSAGEYMLSIVNNTNGCSASESVQVDDNTLLPLAEAGSTDTLTCNVTQATLQGSGSNGSIYAYTWTTQGGNIVSGANSPNPVVNEAGAYTLLVTNTTSGCTQTDIVQIIEEANVPLDFDVELERPTCMDDDGAITFGQVQGGFGPYRYSIDGGQNYSSTLDFASIEPGIYNLYIQDANGCEIQQQLTVPMAPDPFVSTTPVLDIQLGEEQKLTAVLGTGYPLSLIDSIIWTPLDGLIFEGTSLLKQLTPLASPLRTTEYTVTIISKDGCKAEARVLIRVDGEPRIYIPNAISPWNVDGYNDVFLIFADNDQIDKVDIFQVFDRWGGMVFSDKDFLPNDRAHGWDGTHRGKLMTPAVFVYYAKVRLIDGRVLKFKGDVTLLR